MRVQRLPLLPLVPIGGLLLVQLRDVVLGVLGVLLFTCRGRENEWNGKNEKMEAKPNVEASGSCSKVKNLSELMFLLPVAKVRHLWDVEGKNAGSWRY